MADILRQFETVAAIATAIMPTRKMMLAMLTIQSAPSAVEKATSQNKLLFAVYMLLLLAIAFVGWLVWKSGNRLQDEIRIDANARIAEADSKAATANENAGKANERAGIANEAAGKANDSAAQANTRAGQLENDNLVLRGQVATLETAAAEAKTAQLQMEKSLEETKARTVDALAKANEAGFAAFKEKWEREQQEMLSYPRVLNTYRTEEYRERLRAFAGTEVVLITLPDTEPSRTAGMIAELLDSAGWKVLRIEQRQGTTAYEIPDGIWIELDGFVGPGPQQSPLTPAIETLRDILSDSKMLAQRSGLNRRLLPAKLPPNTVRVVVGLPPDWLFRSKKDQIEGEQERQRRRYLLNNEPIPARPVKPE